ncbi:MAG: site-specific integrase [Pseudomonadota bacterium]
MRETFTPFGRGFYLRRRPGRSPAWVVQYDVGGRTRRKSLGDPSIVSLDEAAVTASEWLLAVRKGRDPIAKANADKAAAIARQRADAKRRGETFGKLATWYLAEAEKRQRQRTFAETRRHMTQHAAPIHALPVADVDADVIQALLDDIAETSGQVASNRCRSVLGAAFNLGMKRRKCPANPVALTDPRPEQARARVLSLTELGKLWNIASGDFGDLVRLLILTGCRRSEVADVSSPEVDLKAAVLSIPAERSKNRRAHKVPLSQPAQRILKAAAQRQPEAEGTPADARLLHAQPYGRNKAKLAEAVGFTDWTLHDIRRSVATRWAEDLDVSTEVIEAALNHVSGTKSGIAGIYNRAEHWRDRVDVAERWASAVLAAAAQDRGLRVAT